MCKTFDFRIQNNGFEGLWLPPHGHGVFNNQDPEDGTTNCFIPKSTEVTKKDEYDMENEIYSKYKLSTFYPMCNDEVGFLSFPEINENYKSEA